MAYIAVEVIALLTVTFLSYLWIYRWQQRNRVGPKSWPLLGCYLEFSANYHRFHDWITDYMKIHPTGTLTMELMGRTVYFVANAENLEYMLKTNWTNYLKGALLHETANVFLGDGIFVIDGERWKLIRKLASLEFSSRKLRDFSSVVYGADAIKLANILAAVADSGKTVDLQDLLLRMTMDSYCKIGFGVDTCTLRPELPRVKFVDAFHGIGNLLQHRQVGPVWKIKRALNIGSERDVGRFRKEIDDYIFNIINTRRVEIEMLKSRGQPVEEDLLSRFMQHKDDEGNILSDDWLRDVVINFLLAGRDTTAGTLAWFIYCVMDRPDITEKCLEEMDKVLDSSADETVSSFVERLTYDNIKDMHYLHATITETLRLYPSVSNDPKFSTKDDVMPDGTVIKAQCNVNYHPYSMGRLKSLWGPDAEEFRPERWLQDGVFQPESPFKFSAFQAGPRICLGIQTAYIQMKITAAILIRFFEFQLEPGFQVQYTVSMILTLLMKTGIKVNVSRRHFAR